VEPFGNAKQSQRTGFPVYRSSPGRASAQSPITGCRGSRAGGHATPPSWARIELRGARRSLRSLTSASPRGSVRIGPGADPLQALRRALTRPPEKHRIVTGPTAARALRQGGRTGGTPVSPLAAIVAPGANARDVLVTRADPPHGSLTTASLARMLRRGPGADPCCELRRAVTRPPEKHVIATGPISPRRLRHHAFLPQHHHLVQALRRAQLRWIGLGYSQQNSQHMAPELLRGSSKFSDSLGLPQQKRI